MATVISYVIGVGTVLACMFVAMLCTDRLFTNIGLVRPRGVRILADVIGSALGFVIGIILITVFSI